MPRMPKRLKFRKQMRGVMRERHPRQLCRLRRIRSAIAGHPLGLRPSDRIRPYCLPALLEASRSDLHPDLPRQANLQEASETRMGKGKAETDFWAARVLPGTILELKGVEEGLAKQAMARMAAKMPVRCRFVGRRLEP